MEGVYGHRKDDLMPTEREMDFMERVSRLNDESVALWNRHDLERFCYGYTESAVYLSEGRITHGRKDILNRYCEAFPDRRAMGKLSLCVKHIRFSSSYAVDEPTRMAVAIIQWNIEKEDGVQDSGFSTVTYVDTNEGVLIAMDSSTS